MDDPILEEKLKNMFENRADELPEDPGREARIRRNVYGQIEREGNFMRKGIMRKTVVALAAICVLGSMTAFAVGQITGITSHSSRYDEVHTYEQALELQKNTARRSIFQRNSPMATHFPLLSQSIMRPPTTTAIR